MKEVTKIVKARNKRVTVIRVGDGNSWKPAVIAEFDDGPDNQTYTDIVTCTDEAYRSRILAVEAATDWAKAEELPLAVGQIIRLQKRPDDWKAYLGGDPAFWDCGQSQAEAVGKLVFSNQELFQVQSIEIDQKEGPELPVRQPPALR